MASSIRSQPIALVCLIALALSSRPAGAARLGTDVVPVRETLRLTVDPSDSVYSGTARIDLQVRRPVREIRFHAENLEIRRAMLSGRSGTRPLRTKAEGPIVAAAAASPVAPGAYVLEIDFRNQFGTRADALYKVAVEGESYAFTDFEPTDARQAWPCWDEPSFKIPWRMVVTVPKSATAISNSPVESERGATGRKTVTFRTSKPLPSYLVALAVGPFDLVPITGMSVPGRVVAVKGKRALAEEAARMTPPLLKALEEYFGRPYPYEKLDLLAVPEFYAGAMENAGAITFRDEILLLDPATVTLRQRGRLAGTVTHELSHMWFGDLVTLAWWDDLWLNESFASWLGDKITARVFPELGTELRDVRSIERALFTDSRPSTHAIRRPIGPDDPLERLFDELAYQKGEAVLGMFEAWLGPDKFRQGVIRYLKEHEWKNAVGSDLWNALSAAAGKDVGAAMATFLDQPGVPLVTAQLDGSRVVLHQERFHNHGAQVPEGRWQIPVILKYDDGSRSRTQTVLLATPSQEVALEGSSPPTWLEVNAGQTGYYRWRVDTPRFLELAQNAGARMNPRERLGFLGDAAALLDAGSLHGDDYLRILASLAGDPEPEVVNTVLDGLTKVRNTFIGDADRGPFALYVRTILNQPFHRWGRARAANEPEIVSSLRPGLLVWLGDSGHDASVLAYAESLAVEYRKNAGAIDPALVDAALDLAATRGDRALFADYRARSEGAATPVERVRYLTALAWFREPELVDSALAYALRGPLRPQDRAAIPRALFEHSETQERVYQWATRNYDRILSLTTPSAAYFLPYYAGGCSAERLGAARAFFAEPAHNRPGLDREIAKVADQVGDCVGLREREGGNVATYLRGIAMGSKPR